MHHHRNHHRRPDSNSQRMIGALALTLTHTIAVAADGLGTPRPVSGAALTGVAMLGFLVILLVARLLHGGHDGAGPAAVS